MNKIIYKKTVPSLLQGADSLLIAAPAATLSRFPKILAAKLERLLQELAKGLKPGIKGTSASSLTGTTPRRLVVAALPNEVSRYNCKANPECIQRLVGGASLGSRKKDAILLVLDKKEHLLPAMNGVGRAFPLFSRKSGDSRRYPIQVLAVDKKGEPLAVDATTRATVDCTREAARLVDTPPTELGPEALAKEARKLLRGIKGVRVTEIVGPGLLEKKLLGIHSVGRAALKPPRLLIARYTPAKGRMGARRHIALVGKGITFDTGGLNLKGASGMSTMKSDMGGAAAVLGAFRVLASTGCAHRLSLLLCLAENAIGPASYKPDDVLTLHSGKTVEINNTDAEGRLVLADGVSYAARVLKVDTIFDAATLTGAQLVATGTNHAAIFSNQERLEKLTVRAGQASGDLVHPLMFAPELYKREYRSAVADMRNSVRNRSNAQVSCAAQFIYWHIEDVKVDWCHVDLAGPAMPTDRGTGFGTALLSEAVRQLR